MFAILHEFVCLKGHVVFRPNLPPHVIAPRLPNHSTKLHEWEAELADELWAHIRSKVDSECFFGIALDAGIDRLLHEYVLIGVLYVASAQFLLPPMYSRKHAAFDGKEAAHTLINSLAGVLHEDRIFKLRFLQVDGSTVNHVARIECEEYMGNLAEFYGRIQDIGSTDRINIQLGVRERLPKITLLRCVGHVLNNIAKQTLKDYENKPIFRLKRSFCNAFYSGAQTSAKQGKYRGVALGVQLAKFEKRVVDAEIFFMQSYGALGMEDAPNSWILNLESRIREALYVLKPVVGESADLLLSELNNADNTKEKHEILIKHGAQIPKL